MYQRIRKLSVLISILVLGGACGNETAPTPTVTPPQTPVIDLSTATLSIPTSTVTFAIVETPTQGAVSGDPPASPVAGQRLIGDIADAMGIAWLGVTSYRVTSVNQAIAFATPAGATPIADLPSVSVVDEFALPSRRHRIQTEGGTTTLELIIVDGVIFARGTAVPGFPTGSDPMLWRQIDASLLDPASPFGEMYSALLEPVTAPYSGLSDEERERIAVPAGTVIINGKSCDVFETADTTVIGERVTILIAIGDDDLPCSIETHVASTVNVSTFAYNIPVSIDVPVNP